MPSKEEFQRKMTRYNTKEMYTQPKYNLLREESEGYTFPRASFIPDRSSSHRECSSGSSAELERKRGLSGNSHELWDTPGGRGQSKPFNRRTVAQH